MLGTVVDGGADNGASCLVSMGCGMVFSAVNNALEFAGNTSAMIDVQIAVQAQGQCFSRTLFEGSHRGWQFTGSSLNGGLSWAKKRASWEKGGS